MSRVLDVVGLTKDYPKFKLDEVTFSVEKGSIMGLIGRNGAGKTTTIKAILNLTHRSSGKICYFGMPLEGHENEIKQRIGYTAGAVDYYKKKKIRDILAITKGFYSAWDESAWQRFMRQFELDEDKSPSQLSEGMKVKLNLAMALSHGAEILILDEPTSGLDPISRDELLDIFRMLAREGTAILFSTHIISDLDKCADEITYIQRGRVAATGKKQAWLEQCRRKGYGDNLEEIMIHLEKEARYEAFAGERV
ncbi:MAG: ABC transporter ATP-binding protein [Oscillospiraceae bacterium]|nr:ABC transporter ATP-binding protein [Oscillospiraceae bacterium]